MTAPTKHTPGPWVEIRSRGDYVIQERRRSNRKRIIASVDVVNGEANARLIAAAPELLDALKAAVAYPITGNWYEMAEAAIAKAEGRDA